MKRIVPLCLLFCSYCSSSRKEIVVSYHYASLNPTQAHLSANVFAVLVGDRLKVCFPSMVSNVSVQIKERKDSMIFTWSCIISACTPLEAETHFDRRGTLLFGITKKEARKSVEVELEQSKKVLTMINGFDKTYGNHHMPNSFVSTDFAKYQNGYWCLKEFFCTAP